MAGGVRLGGSPAGASAPGVGPRGFGGPSGSVISTPIETSSRCAASGSRAWTIRSREDGVASITALGDPEFRSAPAAPSATQLATRPDSTPDGATITGDRSASAIGGGVPAPPPLANPTAPQPSTFRLRGPG